MKRQEEMRQTGARQRDGERDDVTMSAAKQNGADGDCPNIKKAVLLYAAKPSEEQLARLTEFLKEKLDCSEIELELKEDPSLISGFVLRADSREYDFSARGQLSS